MEEIFDAIRNEDKQLTDRLKSVADKLNDIPTNNPIAGTLKEIAQFNLRDVAFYTGMSYDTLRKNYLRIFKNAGIKQITKIGKNVSISLADVKKLIQHHTIRIA